MQTIAATYTGQGRKYDRDHKIYTPTWLAKRLFDIVRPVVRPHTVLDPCVGSGQLLEPWHESANTIGVDVDAHCPLWADWFFQYPFDLLTTWSHKIPDLIMCNPPFNGSGDSQERMMYPEVFLRTIVSLFGSDSRIILFVPHGFRMNCSTQSKRFKWLSSPDAPQITSIMSLQNNVFPEVTICSEILVFNVPGLKPHYFLNE